ncbi:ACT domain-containing protein [Aphelenchoides fujianensis]|nr:ACT domain-containing protein [Aphelenchoides fujianensis]
MSTPTGETDLKRMLRTLEPTVREGSFVFVSLPSSTLEFPSHEAMIREDEGITLVMRKEEADIVGLLYAFVASWITLSVHSSLDAVGLTAAFSAALTKRGVSCNVLAGYFHDHILVPATRTEDALNCLRELAAGDE